MLELKEIVKAYQTANLVQVALNKVSVAFRDNEFVAVLGQSGSGKTTMLNVIGGLDRFQSGDLVIDGISTKNYKARDWDAYRNNRIGGLRVKMCVWLGVSRGLDLAFLNAD